MVYLYKRMAAKISIENNVLNNSFRRILSFNYEVVQYQCIATDLIGEICIGPIEL